MDRPLDGRMNGWADRQTDRQTDGWTDRQKDGQTDRPKSGLQRCMNS